ncbi:MAG: hypothetical protein QME71_02620 [Dehalococcoidia bacterium]|nr:hypothetical protein [Dehalococcoidia bacterium]
MRSNSNGRLASVQELLPLEDVVDDVLCLRGGDYRSVLEAQSVNFALKSEAEQEAIMAGYRAFLNSLSYPIQVVVRILPTDVESYLAGLRERFGGRGGEVLRRLALDHETFVRRLGRERTLLEQHFYVVVPAGLEGSFERRGVRWPWQRVPSSIRHNVDAAARQLGFRCQELIQSLASFGVVARRLNTEEMVQFWSAFLRSEVAPSPTLAASQRPVVTGGNREEVGARG